MSGGSEVVCLLAVFSGPPREIEITGVDTFLRWRDEGSLPVSSSKNDCSSINTPSEFRSSIRVLISKGVGHVFSLADKEVSVSAGLLVFDMDADLGTSKTSSSGVERDIVRLVSFIVELSFRRGLPVSVSDPGGSTVKELC